MSLDQVLYFCLPVFLDLLSLFLFLSLFLLFMTWGCRSFEYHQPIKLKHASFNLTRIIRFPQSESEHKILGKPSDLFSLYACHLADHYGLQEEGYNLFYSQSRVHCHVTGFENYDCKLTGISQVHNLASVLMGDWQVKRCCVQR